MLADNVRGLRVDEALFVPPGGYRSTLGTLKHIAGWSHVYRSYAFEPDPRQWEHIDWPCGLRDTVEPGQSYLNDVIAWAQRRTPTTVGHRVWPPRLSAST